MPKTEDAVTPADMLQDSETALLLAENRPTGSAATAVRERLRQHIRALLEPAERYAAALEDGRARDIVNDTIRHARVLAQDSGGDPAAMLRLLSKAVTFLLRYTQGTPR